MILVNEIIKSITDAVIGTIHIFMSYSTIFIPSNVMNGIKLNAAMYVFM